MAVSTIVLFIFLLLVCPNTTNGAEDHQVGKRDVAPHCGVFGPDQEQQQRLQLVGKRGQKGEPSAIDYGQISRIIDRKLDSKEFDEKIQSIIDKKLDEAMIKMEKSMDAKLLRLEMTFTNSIGKLLGEFGSPVPDDQAIEKTKPVQDELCGIRYNGVCFWLVMKVVTFKRGRNLCKEKGGEVAGTYSSEHYVLVTSYIRSMMPKSSSVSRIWLGMTINPQTRVVSPLDGESSPFVFWYPDKPQLLKTWTHIYVIVRKVASEQYQGMANDTPSSTYHGVLCQI